MSHRPPEATRAEAAAALLVALRDVRDILDRLQLAAAWVLEAYGDTTEAETIRMLPVAVDGRARPGRPPVPPAAPSDVLADLIESDRFLPPSPDSVTGDETESDR